MHGELVGVFQTMIFREYLVAPAVHGDAGEL
jgi:hypothetical protein